MPLGGGSMRGGSLRLRPAARAVRGAVTMVAALASIAALGACDVITSVGPRSCDTSPEDNPPQTYSDGTVTDGIYMSSPWDRDLLSFRGGVQIRFEHKLGAVPRSWQAYLSFDQSGIANGTVAEAAGNQVELVSIDDQAIIVRNNSCADYWLILTAEAGSVPGPSGGGGGP